MTTLSGKTVLITRAAEDCQAWAERLEAEGAQTVSVPCITTETIGGAAAQTTIAAELPRAEWLVFTSRRGVEAFAALGPHTLNEKLKIAVVGPATAAAAKRALKAPELVSEAGTAASLAHELAERIAPQTRVLIAVAENAGDIVETALAEAAAACVRVNVYRTVPAPVVRPKQKLSTLGADHVLLASPSAVTGFCNQLEIDIDAKLYTIGPSTTAAAEAAGLAVKAQAEQPSLEGLMEAMR
jgi:uroporphyrinogen-III synthase